MSPATAIHNTRQVFDRLDADAPLGGIASTRVAGCGELLQALGRSSYSF